MSDKVPGQENFEKDCMEFVTQCIARGYSSNLMINGFLSIVSNLSLSWESVLDDATRLDLLHKFLDVHYKRSQIDLAPFRKH